MAKPRVDKHAHARHVLICIVSEKRAALGFGFNENWSSNEATWNLRKLTNRISRIARSRCKLVRSPTTPYKIAPRIAWTFTVFIIIPSFRFDSVLIAIWELVNNGRERVEPNMVGRGFRGKSSYWAMSGVILLIGCIINKLINALISYWANQSLIS